MRHPAQRGERKAAEEKHALRKAMIEQRYQADRADREIRREPFYTGAAFRKPMPQGHRAQ